MINYSQKQMLYILANLFYKLRMTQIDQVYKRKSVMVTRKYLILAGLLKKAGYSAKITEIESKIPSITSLATTDALIVVEHKMSNINNPVKNRL